MATVVRVANGYFRLLVNTDREPPTGLRIAMTIANVVFGAFFVVLASLFMITAYN